VQKTLEQINAATDQFLTPLLRECLEGAIARTATTVFIEAVTQTGLAKSVGTQSGHW
jgi:hypothetical protein